MLYTKGLPPSHGRHSHCQAQTDWPAWHQPDLSSEISTRVRTIGLRNIFPRPYLDTLWFCYRPFLPREINWGYIVVFLLNQGHLTIMCLPINCQVIRFLKIPLWQVRKIYCCQKTLSSQPNSGDLNCVGPWSSPEAESCSPGQYHHPFETLG